MKKILKEVLKEIQPDKKYQSEILRKTNAIVKQVNKDSIKAKAVLGGSGAKGTSLKTFDADIFVKFDYKTYHDKSDKLSDLLEKFLKKHFKAKRLHGSRDYFQIIEGEYTFEIIPILEIKSADQAKNITDVSPLHSKFVLTHKKLVNEMRLTKQFFKAANAYGAESHIKGFSGYVCEILTIYYGSFEKLVKAIPKWKDKTVIDVMKFYKNKNVLMELNKSKLISPLIVIDPVQHNRNAAAALEHEKFELMKKRAKAFLKKPDASFFAISKLSVQDLKKKHKKNLAVLKLKPLNKKEDVAGAKALKILHFLIYELGELDFKIKKSDLVWDHKEALVYFVFEKDKLSSEIIINGPLLHMKRHAQAFKKKHKNAKVKGKRLVAKSKRKHTDAHSALRALVNKKNVTNNCSKISLL